MLKEDKVNSKGQILLYKNKVEVKLEKETVWLNQKQMAELFDKDVKTINEHIRNIYKEQELYKDSTIWKFQIVQTEGNREVKRQVEHYNLDVIISVGYRVKSQKGTQFRIWATNILKNHLIDGYTINEKRLKQEVNKYKELQKSIALLNNIIDSNVISDESKGFLSVITEYTKALDLLDDYDHQRLIISKKGRKSKFKLTYELAQKIICAMKNKFKDSELVGKEKDESFKSSISAIYQTFDGKDLYPTVEEKAAHLLYFVTKNHSFVDGNKRIAAAIFICFLEKNKILYKKTGLQIIDNNTLVALIIMIAESKASQKDTIIKIIVNLMKD